MQLVYGTFFFFFLHSSAFCLPRLQRIPFGVTTWQMTSTLRETARTTRDSTPPGRSRAVISTNTMWSYLHAWTPSTSLLRWFFFSSHLFSTLFFRSANIHNICVGILRKEKVRLHAGTNDLHCCGLRVLVLMHKLRLSALIKDRGDSWDGPLLLPTTEVWSFANLFILRK